MNSQRLGTSLCCALGVCGAVACSVAMFALPLGIVGASVAAGAKADSMQNMSGMPGADSVASRSVPPWIAALNHVGPELMVASVALVLLAALLRKSTLAAGTALAAGGILYYGMYAQARMSIMWVFTAIGLTLLVVSAIGIPRIRKPYS